MNKLINLFTRRLTLGNLLAIIASFIFAIALRQLFLYNFDILPIKGELQVIDISFTGIIIFFRFLSSVFIEFLLEDKFHTPLFQGVAPKGYTPLYMDNTANTNNSGKSKDSGGPHVSPSKEPITEEKRAKVREMIKNKAEQDPGFKQRLEEDRKYHAESHAHATKMDAVLSVQTSKIMELSSLASRNDVKLIQVNGGLELSIPANMTDDLAEKISKSVGALDRGLQNKFSEYENLSRKDVRLYNSQ